MYGIGEPVVDLRCSFLQSKELAADIGIPKERSWEGDEAVAHEIDSKNEIPAV
jgi:hypothetical protein